MKSVLQFYIIPMTLWLSIISPATYAYGTNTVITHKMARIVTTEGETLTNYPSLAEAAKALAPVVHKKLTELESSCNARSTIITPEISGKNNLLKDFLAELESLLNSEGDYKFRSITEGINPQKCNQRYMIIMPKSSLDISLNNLNIEFKILNVKEEDYVFTRIVRLDYNKDIKKYFDLKNNPSTSLKLFANFSYKPKGTSNFRILSEKDTIRRGDAFKLDLRVTKKCWIYLVNFDSTGKGTAVFPNNWGTLQNPISSNQDITIPEGEVFGLDELTGQEEFILWASLTRQPALEKLLSQLNEVPKDSERGTSITRSHLKKQIQTFGIEKGITHAAPSQEVTPSDHIRLKILQSADGLIHQRYDFTHGPERY